MKRLPIRCALIGMVILALSLGCNSISLAPAEDKAEAPSATVEVEPDAQAAVTSIPSGPVIRPEQFEYMGAFRLSEGGDRPDTFAYGGGAMTYRPDGDPDGAQDGFPGSLFITGHDRLPYGELPNGNQVAEVDIPVPIRADSIEELNRSEFVQGLTDVAAGFFEGLDELPRVGMLYLDHPATGAKVHLTWGQHLQPDNPFATHAWFDPALDDPQLAGPWSLDVPLPYSVNGYMLEIPAAWAEAYTGGSPVGTGRFRDGGWSGMGPAVYAYRPWTSDSGTPAEEGATLPVVTLLRYESSEVTETFEHALAGYQHPDQWEGAAWLTTASGESAVLFAGNKGTGTQYWYGYMNPSGPDEPCVDGEMVGTFTVCRMADGTPCPESDLVECAGHTDYRGWWTTRWDAQFILYDPADLADVAAGVSE
ncbi:MAG: hypothetical protein NTU91_13010, partial [Chloroflexi bacterium]|nr:hypothetical protein [Chloroflexota bacterium]